MNGKNNSGGGMNLSGGRGSPYEMEPWAYEARGRNRGLEQGRREGHEEGYSDGRSKGRSEGYVLVIPHIFDHMDIPRTMSSSRRIPFQITSFPGGLSFFLAR